MSKKTKRRLSRLLLLLSVISFLLAGCGGVKSDPAAPLPMWQPPEREIPAWPEGTDAVVSLAFDEGTSGHVHLAAPALEKRGLRGTFYLVADEVGTPGNGTTWEEWHQVAAAGHEIGGLRRQTLDGQVDLLSLPHLMPTNDSSLETIEEELTAAFERGDWVILTFQGISGEQPLPGEVGRNPRPIEDLEKVLDMLEGSARNLWIAPVCEVTEYARGGTDSPTLAAPPVEND